MSGMFKCSHRKTSPSWICKLIFLNYLKYLATSSGTHVRRVSITWQSDCVCWTRTSLLADVLVIEKWSSLCVLLQAPSAVAFPAATPAGMLAYAMVSLLVAHFKAGTHFTVMSVESEVRIYHLIEDDFRGKKICENVRTAGFVYRSRFWRRINLHDDWMNE